MTPRPARAAAAPRTSFVRGFGAFAAVFALAFGVLLAAPAAAVPAPEGTGARPAAAAPKAAKDPYDRKNFRVTIAEAQLSHKNSPNHITMEITVRNKDKTPTTAAYAVFLTFNRPGAEPRDLPAGCQDEYYNNPEVLRGTYRCTAIIEGPGDWEFTATVNQPALQAQRILTTVDTTLNFPDAIKTLGLDRGLKYLVQGSAFEVFLLQFHLAVASLWLLLAAAMAFLAVPRLRRTLSVLAVHTLEVRRGFLTSSLWAAFIGTVGSGLYLVATQVAYQAPFSTKRFSFSAWDKLDALPYGQNYFLVLYGKILIFGVMALASVILMIEAGRKAQQAQDSDSLDRDDDDDMWSHNVHFDEEGHVLHDDDVAVAGGVTASIAGTKVRAQRRTSQMIGISGRTLTVCVIVLVVGTVAIGAAVTGLKYLHELIEMASAVGIVRGGG